MSGTFRKRSPQADPDFFAVEAAGLRWLAAAGPDAAKVAEVVEVSAVQIVLQRLQSVRPTPAAAEAFGRALWNTHAAGATAFGQPPDGWTGDGYIGQQRMTMEPAPTWGRFFAEQRVLPYTRQARDRGNLSAAGAATVDRISSRLRPASSTTTRSPPGFTATSGPAT